MEKFFLRLLFAGNELYIVHQQDVCVAVFVVKFQLLALTDSLNQSVGEIIALDIDNLGPGIVLADGMGNSVDQMGLAQSRVAVDQQGIVRLCRRVGHGPGRGMGHKIFKGELARFDQGRGLCHDAFAVGIVVLVAQKPHFKVGGKNIAQRSLDVSKKALLDVAALEVRRTVKGEHILFQSHGAHVIEPGVNGRFRQLTLHALENIAPDVGNGIHKIRFAPFLFADFVYGPEEARTQKGRAGGKVARPRATESAK